MKSITVKYVSPTNTRASRWLARAEGVKPVRCAFSHDGKDQSGEPWRAAQALAIKYGWTGTYFEGTLPDGTTKVYVNAGTHSAPLPGAAFHVLKGDIEMHRGMGLVK